MNHSPDTVEPRWKNRDPSRLEVSRSADKSRLTVCKSAAPLRMINPRIQGPACHVLLTHLGGGMVDGDSSCLDVVCREGARLHVGSVGNLHVYEGGLKGTFQHIHGNLERNALAVFGADPVVPHSGSLYRQSHEWHMHPEASLLIAELMTGGRVESGECFSFTEYGSHISVFVAEQPLLREAFIFRPGEHDYLDPAMFAGRPYFLTMYLLGQRWEHLAGLLSSESALVQSSRNATGLASVYPLPRHGYVLRAVSSERAELDRILDLVYRFLDDKDFLGFNPRERKY